MAVFLLCKYLYPGIKQTTSVNLPPGPTGCSLIMFLLQAFRNPIVALENAHKTFGDIYSVKIGPISMVIVNGIEAMTEVLVTNGKVFAGRPDLFVKLTGNDGQGLLTRQHDAAFITQRALVSKCLRCTGKEQLSLDARIQHATSQLIEWMDGKSCQLLDSSDASRYLQTTTANVVCSIAYGRQYCYTDSNFQHLISSMDEIFNSNPFRMIFQLARFFPYLTGTVFKELDLRTGIEKVAAYSETVINEHKITAAAAATRTTNKTNVQDIIDAFQTEQRKGGSDLSHFTDTQLVYLLCDMFVSGTETTTTSLNWALLYMAYYPEIQDRVQRELDKVFPKECVVTVVCREHMQSLPYTMATIMEVLRIRHVAYIGVPHCATKDTTLNGFHIPSGTMVITNFWSVHMNDKYWDNPLKFNPERMLGENGRIVTKKAFMPFGAGPRSCLGRHVAKAELFIIFSTLLHRYSYSLPINSPPSTLDPRIGISLTPKPYKLIVHRR
ncbi:cytochrome P450 2J6-like [Saccoglossus kowalevskii]|uniref:Cytochrome P450 2J6-like n=1 Tax=Saccoglossus kowalevskii TaxID=10224 RepID=A0ABM0GMX5_SACKO|nr:PREDICTED: cytochrome P450 2J6-like [Saccoglossus kowalevskii]